MHRYVRAALFVAALVLARPVVVAADGPANGNLIVPIDHVGPGEEFKITGFDIDPGIALSLRLVSGERSDAIGQITVAPNGTLDTTGVVPSDFPLGYAELHAVSAADGTWRTTLLIGPRAEGPGNVDAAVAMSSETVSLVLLAIGLVIFLGAAVTYFRGRQKASSRSV